MSHFHSAKDNNGSILLWTVSTSPYTCSVLVVGFEFQNDNILLQCTLDGVVLQTETIFAKTDKVQANASVTWSSTKGEIKRLSGRKGEGGHGMVI